MGRSFRMMRTQEIIAAIIMSIWFIASYVAHYKKRDKVAIYYILVAILMMLALK